MGQLVAFARFEMGQLVPFENVQVGKKSAAVVLNPRKVFWKVAAVCLSRVSTLYPSGL